MQPRTRRTLGLMLGLAAFAAPLVAGGSLTEVEGYADRPARAAAVTLLMAVFWLFEVLPIHWTACLPLVLFPLLGVVPGGPLANLASAARAFVDPYIFLFLGGMCIAAAMQQQNLHRRVALGVMRGVGTRPPRLLAGVLLATALISMWISNTATATMMVPIAVAVVHELERRAGRALRAFGAALLLAVAYGANVGGLGTKIGTAPNAQLAGFLATRGVELSFGSFFVLGGTLIVLLLPCVWLVLWVIGRRDAPRETLGRDVLERELAALGRPGRAELWVLVIFGLAAAGWILAQPLTALLRPLFAARAGLALRSAHVEAGVAMLAAFALFALRARGRAVLAPRSLRLVPFSALLLLGGGFAMAAGVQGSGLSVWLAERLSGISALHPAVQVGAASLTAVGLSAIASNTATVAVLLPVLANVAAPGAANSVLCAAALAASCDFALPAGTPPNAIVFGSGYVDVPRMARAGVVLDLVAALFVAAVCLAGVPWLVGP